MVSDDGQIKNLKGKILHQRINNSDYPIIDLYIDHVKHTTLVHRVVAETFIPNPENKPTVNHTDGTKDNNHVSNLEWATYTENQQHAIDHGIAGGGAHSMPKGWKFDMNRKQPRQKGIVHKYSDELVINICRDLQNGACDVYALSAKYQVPIFIIRGLRDHRLRRYLTDTTVFIEWNKYCNGRYAHIREQAITMYEEGHTLREMILKYEWDYAQTQCAVSWLKNYIKYK